MKILIFFLLLSFPILSQTYMNVLFTDNSYKNADIEDVTEITFNVAGTEMTTTLNTGSSTDQISDITEIAFDGSPQGGGLPVELTLFTATSTPSTDGSATVLLNWTTATEINNYGFSVLRLRSATENNEWKEIGFVEGHGNSNTIRNYTFTDTSTPLSASSVSYRLKQIDTDGKFEYSEIITVELGALTKYALEQNYPNPFNPTTTIAFSITNQSIVKLSVYNTLGEEVAELVNRELISGMHTINFDASNLVSGIYFYKLIANDFIETKKLLLLK